MDSKYKIGSLATGLGLITLPFGGWFPALIAAGVGVMIGKQQFPAGEKPWRDINELLHEGEHGRLEFKEGLSCSEKRPPFEGLIKSVAAFANTDGGELILGVSDNGKVKGIVQDVERYGGRDKLECAIRNALRNNLDAGVDKLYRMKFELYSGVLLCRIEVRKSVHRVFALNRGDFYRRDGNATISLSARDYHLLKNDNEF